MNFAEAYAELSRICPAAFVLKVEAWHHVGESGAHRDAPHGDGYGYGRSTKAVSP